MQAASQVLWRVNNEYRRRLSQAETLLNLLEQTLVQQEDENHVHTLAVLTYAREEIAGINEEHRHWRYSYYYDSAESKRMVQDDRAVNQALSRFSRMRTGQEHRLRDLYTLIYNAARPDPRLTTVPSGDLWTLMQYAIEDLVTFDNYLNEVTQVG